MSSSLFEAARLADSVDATAGPAGAAGAARRRDSTPARPARRRAEEPRGDAAPSLCAGFAPRSAERAADPGRAVVYLRSDEKYTLVAWEGGEALIRKTIRELADELDPDVFAQIHRSVIVNLRLVAQVDRGFNETAEVHLKDRSEVLPVSRSFLHVFRQM